MPIATRVIRKAGTVTLDHPRGQLLIDGKLFPYVLESDPVWDKTEDGVIVYLTLLADNIEVM